MKPATTFVTCQRELRADAEGEQHGGRADAVEARRARNACSVPMPAGRDREERRDARRHLHEPAFSSDCGMSNASSRNQIVTKRSAQSAACHGTTRPR